MENASKALLIAGAILVAIIIVSLGLFAVNNARNSIQDTSLSAEQKEAFNLKWVSYLGKDKVASSVSGLLTAVIANNASDSTKTIKITYDTDVLASGVAGITEAKPNKIPAIDSNRTFKVEATKYENGIISIITISKQ